MNVEEYSKMKTWTLHQKKNIYTALQLKVSMTKYTFLYFNYLFAYGCLRHTIFEKRKRGGNDNS